MEVVGHRLHPGVVRVPGVVHVATVQLGGEAILIFFIFAYFSAQHTRSQDIFTHLCIKVKFIFFETLEGAAELGN